MSFNEALHAVCPSLSIKMALGIGLFNNALLAMGTDRHKKFYDAAWLGNVSYGYTINSANIVFTYEIT